MPLTDKQIKALQPEIKAKKYFDGEGLYLEVAPIGGKWWRLKYRVNGVEKRISLGTYPEVSLLEARDSAPRPQKDRESRTRPLGGAVAQQRACRVIQAMVDVTRPRMGESVCDPACGTGGFLLAAYEYLKGQSRARVQLQKLREKTFFGTDIVDEVVRLCAMNLYLHGIGGAAQFSPVQQADALAVKPERECDIILTNPPFGKKSSYRIVGEDGAVETERETYERDDFRFTTSNKQFNFLQHIMSTLKVEGRAAVVLPDNVLFEAGAAGEGLRRRLLEAFDFHTLLRLPTGIFYKPGVKANVLFFDKKPASKTTWTKDLWVYDLRTNKHFTLKERPLTRVDLDDFVTCYNADNRSKRQESERFKRFSAMELLERDKTNLDIFWLKDDSLTDLDNLPAPEVIAAEIVENLEAALEQFGNVVEMLGRETKK